jgi:hypothetical protein
MGEVDVGEQNYMKLPEATNQSQNVGYSQGQEKNQEEREIRGLSL